MSRRILRYETGDGERFAVWSTVVDDWIWYDLTAQELREWYFGQKMEQARQHITTRIGELRDGVNPYRGWDPDEKRERLIEVIDSDG